MLPDAAQQQVMKRSCPGVTAIVVAHRRNVAYVKGSGACCSMARLGIGC